MSASIYRTGVWFIKGLREYTKSGYESAAKSFNAADLDVNCAGRSYMVTGANSGIGKEVSIEIAKRGGEVHMVCRSKERGEEAQQEIQEQSSNQNVHLHILDMSEPGHVYTFAKEFSKPLHVLINNAGCMINERETHHDGLEKNFCTNTLGTHILTAGLIPKLKEQEDPRVIIVSSGGMLPMKLDVKDLQFAQMRPFDGTKAYAQNKRQQIVMTEKYSVKYPEIHFSAMHPGWADTPAVRSAMPDFYNKMKTRLRTAAQGADTLVWLAISPPVKTHNSGLFFQDRKPVATHLPLAWSRSNTGDEDKLMELLQGFEQQFSS